MLFRRLFELSAIFWTEANGGHWIKLLESVFLENDVTFQGSSDECDVARTFLAKSGIKMVQIPGMTIFLGVLFL